MRPRQLIGILGTALLLCSPLTLAHEAHVHGVGKLDIVLDGTTLSLHLDSPLVNLIGYEHAARSAKEQQAAQEMSRRLRNAAGVFVTDPSAECKVSAVKLVSAALDPALLGENAPRKSTGGKDHDGHADLDADFTFRCTYPERLTTIGVKLFDAFKGFNRIDVQLVTDKRQRAATLTSGAANLAIR